MDYSSGNVALCRTGFKKNPTHRKNNRKRCYRHPDIGCRGFKFALLGPQRTWRWQQYRVYWRYKLFFVRHTPLLATIQTAAKTLRFHQTNVFEIKNTIPSWNWEKNKFYRFCFGRSRATLLLTMESHWELLFEWRLTRYGFYCSLSFAFGVRGIGRNNNNNNNKKKWK